MAKTTDEWYSLMEGQYVTNMNNVGIVADPTTWSQTNLQKIFLYTIAIIANMLDQLFDTLKTDIDADLAAMKPGSVQWYAEMAKKFQYGDDLVPGTDYYDNTGQTDAQIAAKKIVSYAAVVELEKGIRVKVAKTVGVDLGALSSDELAAFTAYMKQISYAGIQRNITSGPADNLKLTLRILYNPLVISNIGARIDGLSATPVNDAIKAHLQNLPFNGVFSVQQLVDSIQAVEGVNDLSVDSVQTKYGALPFTSVDVSVIPDAGYLRIDDADLTLNYIPN